MDARRMRREDLETLWRRLLRVARLDATAFLEVRDDARAFWPAVVVVVVASLLSGLGGWLYYIGGPHAGSGSFFVHSVIIGFILESALWFVWVFVTMVMLQQLFKRRVEFQPLVRTMGLAYFPVALSLLMLIRPIATAVGLVSLSAAVLLSGVAVEASTEAEPAEVLISNLAGFVVFAVILALLGRGGAPDVYAPGLFAFSL